MPTMSESKTITRDPRWSGPAIPPGEMLLEEFLKPLGLRQTQAAERLGISANRLNEVVLGKRRITTDTALRLSRLLQTSPQFWMRLQADWDLHQTTATEPIGVDNSRSLSLLPQPAPNEPVVLYDGEVVLRQGTSEVRGKGSATLRWFPSPGIRLEMTTKNGAVPKFGDKASVELGTMVGDVLVSSFSLGATHTRICGFISSMNDHDTGGLAWLRFQVVNSLDFLTPGLSAVPGDPATVTMRDRVSEQLGDAVRPTSMTKSTAVIRRGPWEVNLVSVPDSSANYTALRDSGGYAFTHVGQIKRTDGMLFATEEVASTLSCLARFLSFARGAACSLPIQWGGDADGRTVWRGFGSPIVDHWSGRSLTWFAPHQGDTLSELFDEFCTAWEHQDLGDPFRMALDWYRQCNAQSGGVRGALILGLTALDLLGWLIVVDHAGKMTAAQYDKHNNARERLTALLEVLNVHPDIPKKYENLAALASANKWNGDVCKALTEIRHGFVHPTPERRKVVLRASDAAFEAWQVSLWLQELALLYLLKHHGSYTNRSRARSVGETEPVPWNDNTRAMDDREPAPAQDL